MTLIDLASLGSFVSGVAVVITLIFLLLQMRQANKNQRAAMRMGRTTRANDLFAMIINPDTARVLVKTYRCEDLDEAETYAYFTFCSAMCTNFEDTYFQYRAGLLDKAIWESEEAKIRALCSQPAFRAMWQFVQAHYGEEFRRYIDDILGQVIVFQPGDFAPMYNMAAHEQLAHAKPFVPPNALGLGKSGNATSAASGA